ncbi:MAG: hypothetical protein GY729_04635 [Desulfobacteraceae bacterium]|nr:hypothetical protein [Desulfobacteraceae bacterium]
MPAIYFNDLLSILIHHQGGTCRIAWVRSSLWKVTYTLLVVTPWRLVARDAPFFLLGHVMEFDECFRVVVCSAQGITLIFAITKSPIVQ